MGTTQTYIHPELCRVHGRFYQSDCALCVQINPPTPELQEETSKFLAASNAISTYFSHWDVGDAILDSIIDECLCLAPVVDFCNLAENESLEYYLLRSRIVIVIKNHIAAYIDGKLTPKN